MYGLLYIRCRRSNIMCRFGSVFGMVNVFVLLAVAFSYYFFIIASVVVVVTFVLSLSFFLCITFRNLVCSQARAHTHIPHSPVFTVLFRLYWFAGIQLFSIFGECVDDNIFRIRERRIRGIYAYSYNGREKKKIV